MSITEIPGASGQPPKELQGPSFETLAWTHTASPSVPNGDTNPLADPTPIETHAVPGESQAGPMRTANEINGGGDIFGGTR